MNTYTDNSICQNCNNSLYNNTKCDNCAYNILTNDYPHQQIMEHMSESDDVSIVLYCLVPYICFVLILWCIAHARGELTLSTGLCIFIFPFIYISYIIGVFIFESPVRCV